MINCYLQRRTLIRETSSRRLTVVVKDGRHVSVGKVYRMVRPERRVDVVLTRLIFSRENVILGPTYRTTQLVPDLKWVWSGEPTRGKTSRVGLVGIYSSGRWFVRRKVSHPLRDI